MNNNIIFFKLKLTTALLILLLLITTSCGDEPTETPIPPDETVSDIDGNIYHTVTIGTQQWIVENLKVITYNDGTAIPLVTDNVAWSTMTTAGYCWYNNDSPTYKSTYGALYNWFAVDTDKLCPTGWHVPTDTEWATLITHLGGEVVAGYKLKESGTLHWVSSNTETTNESGFTALPGGVRYSSGNFYATIGEVGFWWSSSEDPPTNAFLRFLIHFDGGLGWGSTSKEAGMSVRCLKD